MRAGSHATFDCPRTFECPLRLRAYPTGRVDFLKLEIEGAEVDVLLDCADVLPNVRNVFVEYHSFATEEQRLDELLTLLKTSGFRVYIQTAICPPQPFVATPSHLGMDLQLNVFARPRNERAVEAATRRGETVEAAVQR
jgi:Methyltransferase FkbM domain